MRDWLAFTGLLAALAACSSRNKPTAVTSPSKTYAILSRVNQVDRARNDYGKVILLLRNQKRELLDSLDSGAGDFSRWTVGWMAHGDTVVLYSSDIGSKAWKIERNKLKEIALFDDTVKYRAILNRAASLKFSSINH